MKYISIDVEADGPVPGIYSMISLGAVVVGITDQFSTYFAPISSNYILEAMAVTGTTRDQQRAYPDPKDSTRAFYAWLKGMQTKYGKLTMISDNPSFDWQFVNYYLHFYCQENPLGFSARRIGDLFCGFYKDLHFPWKKFRKTTHTHNPLDDAKGNAEAFEYLLKEIENDKRRTRDGSKVSPR